MIRELVATLAFSAAIVCGSSVTAKTPEVLTAVEQLQLRDNLNRGRQIYDYDQAAWHTTDAMVEHVPEAQRARVQGWVVTPASGGHKATYFGREGDRRFVVYSAVWDGTKIRSEIVAPAGSRQPLSAEEDRLATALETAMPTARTLGRCSSAQFNAVVLPGKTPGDLISVYLLTPQTKEGEYPFGGHYRIDLKNGTVAGQRPFTKSCISLNTKGTTTQTVAAMFITHLLDAVPTEIHVFAMLTTGKPLAVGVPGGRVYMLSAPKGVPNAELISPN